jgi:hypothetical protein
VNREGHTGLTLLIFSIVLMPFGANTDDYIVIAIATAFSILPDIDLRLEVLGKFTPNPSRSTI